MNCRVSCKLPGARWTQTDSHVRPNEMQRATMSMHGDIGGEGAPLAALAMVGMEDLILGDQVLLQCVRPDATRL